MNITKKCCEEARMLKGQALSVAASWAPITEMYKAQLKIIAEAEAHITKCRKPRLMKLANKIVARAQAL